MQPSQTPVRARRSPAASAAVIPGNPGPQLASARRHLAGPRARRPGLQALLRQHHRRAVNNRTQALRAGSRQRAGAPVAHRGNDPLALTTQTRTPGDKPKPSTTRDAGAVGTMGGFGDLALVGVGPSGCCNGAASAHGMGSSLAVRYSMMSRRLLPAGWMCLVGRAGFGFGVRAVRVPGQVRRAARRVVPAAGGGRARELVLQR